MMPTYSSIENNDKNLYQAMGSSSITMFGRVVLDPSVTLVPLTPNECPFASSGLTDPPFSGTVRRDYSLKSHLRTVKSK